MNAKASRLHDDRVVRGIDAKIWAETAISLAGTHGSAPPHRMPANAPASFQVRFEKCAFWQHRLNPPQFREHRAVAVFGRRRSSIRGRAGISFMSDNEYQIRDNVGSHRICVVPGRLDEGGFLVAVQAPDRAGLSPFHPVVARAAQVRLLNDFNPLSGTVPQ